MIRGLTSSGHGVETVEALAGTGKTFTAGLLAQAYTAGGYRVLGTAPTGRAVRELTEQAGIGQASTLTRLALDLDADDRGFGSGRAVLILDEAGMASTRETARVMAHARAAGVKVIAIGDSGQLSSVQAGGWLGSLTERLGSHELREVMRQRDPRERQLLAQVRRGDPTDYITEKAARGHLHVYAGDAQRAVAGEHAAVAAWRARQAECPWGQAVLIVRDNERRERLNALIRAELARDGRLGESIHVGGHEFAVGDRVVARRNDRERAVDNGMRGTVIAVDPTEKDVRRAHRRRRPTPPRCSYVAEHLQHAYVLTAHTIQGATVEWAGVVGRPEDFTRNWSYTALSRAREPTELFIIDTPTERELDRTEIAPGQPADCATSEPPSNASRPPCVAATTRTSPSTASTPSARGPAHLEPAHASYRRRPPVRRSSCRPSSRSFASASAATPSTSPTSCTPPAAPGPRRSASPTKRAHASPSSSNPRAVCCAGAPRTPPNARWSANASSSPRGKSRRPPSVSATSQQLPDRAEWEAERRSSASAPPSSTRSSRPAAASTYASRSNDQPPTSRQRSALSPTSRALAAPGSRPPRASRPTASTTPSPTPATPLGPPPRRRRAHWQRARHDLQRAQRDLGQRIDRRHSHEV